jgi:dipeptidyl aminopeptidase/acylaminoacyl peptidase
VPEPDPLERIWIGKDERAGIAVPERKDVPPPPHWRLEAIAHTPRPRSLTVSRDGRTAVFVEDRDTSDLFVLDLERPGAAPERLTTGRDLAPSWEDTQPRISPDGTTVAYADGGHVWLVPTAGGVPRKLVAGGGPVWLADDRLVISIEHEEVDATTRSTRLAVVGVGDPFPRRLARDHDGGLDALGDEEEPAVSPDGAEVAYAFVPRNDLRRAEIRVVEVVTGRVRALTGTPDMADRSPAWAPDGTSLIYVSERSGWQELHAVDRGGGNDRQVTDERADFSQPAWRPDGGRIAAVRGRRNRFDLVLVDPQSGAVEPVSAGGTWARPAWTASGDLVAGYEDHATPAELRRVAATAGAEPAAVHAPAPLAVKRAPHVKPEEVAYESFDGLEIPAFLFRPPNASADAPVAAIVVPHGGPTSAYTDDHDPRAQYFVAKGYAWLAPNFRGSTGYGREFEHRNHGVWGVDDTKDCLAAADYLRTLDWVDGDRLAIVGGSYGSYLATLAVTDDPEHRFRCAVAMYGDVDIVTSWALGDRSGAQDLERMMGHPATARAAYRAGSPVHRLENVQVPILIAHGERDDRVHPQQSEEHVATLRRLGKTFEYVTYPTEAHGFLRAGPQLHFHRRLERFLDWYLM